MPSQMESAIAYQAMSAVARVTPLYDPLHAFETVTGNYLIGKDYQDRQHENMLRNEVVDDAIKPKYDLLNKEPTRLGGDDYMDQLLKFMYTDS